MSRYPDSMNIIFCFTKYSNIRSNILNTKLHYTRELRAFQMQIVKPFSQGLFWFDGAVGGDFASGFFPLD